MTWADLLKEVGTKRLLNELNLGWLFDSDQHPSEQDKAVAWEVYVELRTRITTQELHFLDGDESTALTSVYNLFQLVRDLMKEHGPECRRTAAVVEAMLNQIIRPFTAKWHRRKLAGDLARDDACREFRGELQAVRGKLQRVEMLLYAVATGKVSNEPDDDESDDESDDVPAPPAAITFDRLLGLPDTENWKQRTDSIVAQEKLEIEKRRQAVKLTRGSDDLVGLAISGGGIRSATFALGVVQGLVRRGMLKYVDVMSTVSGGGYLGAFLSSMLNTEPPKKGEPENPPQCGPEPDKPPFKPDVAGDSQAIRELRNHSRYILPATLRRWLLTVGQEAYGVVSNLIILSTLVFAGVLMTSYFQHDTLADLYRRVRSDPPLPPSDVVCTMSWLPTLIWIVSALLLLALPFIQRLGRLGYVRATIARCWEWGTAGAFAIALLATAIEYLSLAHFVYLKLMHAIGDVLNEQDQGGGWSLKATFVTLSSTAGLIAARGDWLRRLGNSYPRLRQFLFGLLWMAGPALFIFAYFELCRVYVADPPSVVFTIAWLGLEVSATDLLWGLFGISIAYAAFINVNFTSLHRYYRNRLAETYLLRQDGDSVKRFDPQPLSALRATDGATAPYHLINAALNLPSSDVAELRGRDCDFFLFSKHFCGGRVVGYHATDEWEAADAHLDLGTAVAISGAAAAPQMGMGTIRGASFLLTVLNVRLGYWLRRPSRSRAGNDRQTARHQEAKPSWLKKCWTGFKRALTAPGPWYLLREAFNWIDYRRRFWKFEWLVRYLNLSDGGHIENLGMYELLRRRCKYIVAIDGECDPTLDCPSLMKLQQFAKVDLDVEIEMDVERLKWIEFIPAEARPRDDEKNADAVVRPVKERIRYSRGHFAVGKIKYPPDENGNAVTGWLIYVKLSITGNEPDYIKDYRRRYPEFPHQSTGDQIFEEDQFEAYRRLGDHITDDLFSDELLDGEARLQAIQQQLAFSDWYDKIVSKFIR